MFVISVFKLLYLGRRKIEEENMKKRLLSILAIVLSVVMASSVMMGQSSRSRVKERVRRHLWYWAAHNSVISQEGTFARLVREAPSAATDENTSLTWKFQIVPLSGDPFYLTLPGYPSHFAFGESDKLFVTIPDPQAWQNREGANLPAGAKTKLYIISAPYQDAQLNSAIVVDLDGFAGSLRVRNIGGKVYAYLTVRELTENPSQVAEENEWDRWLVVVDLDGNSKYTELK
jgi:hypothetical protein